MIHVTKNDCLKLLENMIKKYNFLYAWLTG